MSHTSIPMKTNTAPTEQKRERTLTGTVVSTGMKDTIVVLVERFRKHPKYRKYLTRSKRLKVHDQGNTCVVGDIVRIRETRPISKDKHHRIVQRVKSSETKEESLPETSENL